MKSYESFFKTTKLISLITVVLFNSCKEDEPCEGEVTTFTLPDGTTRSFEQPCFENSEPFQDPFFNNF